MSESVHRGTRHRAAVVLVTLAVVLLALVSCGKPPRAQSVVLLSIDTWRADRLGAGGHPTLRTPQLDRFFRRATQYAQAYSPAPTTLAAHASMLTGLWPFAHGVPRNGWPLESDVPTLPEALSKQGIATGAFVSSAALDPRFGLGRGFDVYDYEGTQRVEREQGWRPARETLERALAWWRAESSRRRFLLVHLFEPHFPYEPSAPDLAICAGRDFAGLSDSANAPDFPPALAELGSMRFLFAMWEDASLFTPLVKSRLEALYNAEITGLDRTLGRTLAEFADSPGTLVVIVADHGESLGEHGLNFKHGLNVYDADVHVPLAIAGPSTFEPRVDDTLVSTIDLARTFAAALGARGALPEAGDARDLASLTRGEDLPVFAEASMPWNVESPGAYPNRLKQRAVRTREATLVVTPWDERGEWFVRSEDPGEVDPRPIPSNESAAKLMLALREWGSRGVPREPPTGIDPALLEQLHGLGYVDR